MAFILGGIVLVFMVVVCGIFWMFSVRRDHAAERGAIETTRVAAEEETLVIDGADWDALEPLAEGASVPLKHFVLMMEDPRATELARATFRSRANGAPVAWRMTLDDVRDSRGLIEGDFSAPYMFRVGQGMTGSSVMVRAEFGETQRDALIGLRQGERVTIAGRLSLDDGQAVRITDASVVKQP